MGFLNRLRQKPPPPPELDRVMVAQLRGRGADLARARHVLHFLDFPDEPSARSASEAVEHAGYDVTVERADESDDDTLPRWSLKAEATRVIDETTVDAYRALFERIAAEHGGEYDGWEASAKP